MAHICWTPKLIFPHFIDRNAALYRNNDLYNKIFIEWTADFVLCFEVICISFVSNARWAWCVRLCVPRVFVPLWLCVYVSSGKYNARHLAIDLLNNNNKNGFLHNQHICILNDGTAMRPHSIRLAIIGQTPMAYWYCVWY